MEARASDPSPRERQDAPRVDIRDKVTGRAVYLEDVPEPPGTLYAAAIRSPYSHARIRSIDSSRAERLPGVVAILHGGNVDQFEIKGAPSSWKQEFIASDHVYDSVVRHAAGLVDPTTFRRVRFQVKESKITSWIHLAG